MSDAEHTSARELFRIAAIDRAAIEAAVRGHSARIARILPDSAQVEHVGATAVPGCLTKGDIDLAVRVPAKDFAAADHALAALIERNNGSHHSADFASFADAHSRPELGVQLIVRGSALDVFSAFRDALLADPVLLESYNTLKLTWDGRDMVAYRAAKSAFIERALRLSGASGDS